MIWLSALKGYKQMKSTDYFSSMKKDYDVVRVLSDKNDSLSVLVKHKELKNYLVYRYFHEPVWAYDFLKRIAFENLPLVYDAFLAEDGQIVLEEYIDGITVADVLENGTYTYFGAKKVIFDVCDALKILHTNGFVHRDIKPENIMISKSGTVKLIDFNASRKQSVYASADTVQMGTIGYASPEQLGIAQSDVRTDIYALGVLLNVMLTGTHPTKQLAKGRAQKIILKCTQINPDLRFKDIADLKAAF